MRLCHPEPGVYTFWDYQAGCWQKDDGIRIDHLLLSPQAADRLVSAQVDRFTRGWEKPSDHVPVWIELTPDAAGPEPQRPSPLSFGSRGCAAAIRDLIGSLEAAHSPSTSRIARTTDRHPGSDRWRAPSGDALEGVRTPIRNRAARGALFVV